MFGKADPYVRAKLANQVVRSQTINNNQVYSLTIIIVQSGTFSQLSDFPSINTYSEPGVELGSKPYD